ILRNARSHPHRNWRRYRRSRHRPGAHCRGARLISGRRRNSPGNGLNFSSVLKYPKCPFGKTTLRQRVTETACILRFATWEDLAMKSNSLRKDEDRRTDQFETVKDQLRNQVHDEINRTSHVDDHEKAEIESVAHELKH